MATFVKKKLRIAPSIFAADFGKLADEAKRIADSGADAIHVDLMDGHFVPNLTLGPKALAAINCATDLFLDVHIMVYNPYDYVERLIENGANGITFHFEATEDVEDTLQFIRRCNAKAGLAFCPETSVSMIPKYLDKCDKILLMTVNPGFGGQAFIPDILEKIEFTRDLCNKLQIRDGGKSIGVDTPADDPVRELGDFLIQVDGGINLETAKQCIDAGANDIVAGTYLFEGDMASKINQFRELG
ncbi:MAG: ribulose-phosphate 3-epimerase [Rhabdochlamydiaceae bacterium]|nr:ribulose-phosphate 3-epimerase [Candidatus Amphrikana amoebophyrae]